jgi:superfamily II DNA/RNA helicase
MNIFTFILKFILQSGCHILVVTPGRLMDMVNNRNFVSYDDIRFIVLDEADRMLDNGFQSTIEEMMNHNSMPKAVRHTEIFFTFCILDLYFCFFIGLQEHRHVLCNFPN